MPILIREYDATRDGPRIRQCVVALQEFERRLEPSLPEGEAMADACLTRLSERCSRSAGRIVVAEDDSALVGFVAVLTRVSPEEPDESQQDYAYVSDLVVLPPYRARGIGRTLLEQAEAIARASGAPTLRVDVLARNGLAHDLYRRSGFRDFHVGMVKDL